LTKAAARRAFDRGEAGLIRTAARHPRTAVALATSLGRLRNFLSRQWPAPSEVESLFAELGPRESESAARVIAGRAACNRVLGQAGKQFGIAALRPLLLELPPWLREYPPPYVIGFAHVGTYEALGPSLERLSAPVLLWRDGAFHASTARLEIVTTEGGAERRAGAFLQAVACLQSGGIVATALDVLAADGLPVELLDRSVRLARGPFALARRVSASLIPLVGVEETGRVRIVAGAPLVAKRFDGDAGEARLAQRAAAWFDSFLRQQPGELGLGLLRSLLGSPRAVPRSAA
jgi:hypothetical protein